MFELFAVASTASNCDGDMATANEACVDSDHFKF